MPDFAPAYLSLDGSTFCERAHALREMMRGCTICPRNCRVDRLAGEVGACRVGWWPMVSSYGPHFGEEAPLVGRHGSGGVFLTHCNLKCVFCQNHGISHLGDGEVVSIEALAGIMRGLYQRGCHNINWVTPTHQVAMLVEALALAAQQGLRAPIVYNCGGYESLETLRLLDGIVDIYMPDAKYSDNAVGLQLSGAADYWDRCREALGEMHRQVGDLQIGSDGIATRGLLVRHLVLPSGLAGTAEVMRYLAELSADTYVNVMAQYHPRYRAREFPAVNRPVTCEEFKDAVDAALRAGLRRLDGRWSPR